MIRTLLATTAIASLLATGAIAQDATPPADPNATQQPADQQQQPADQQQPAANQQQPADQQPATQQQPAATDNATAQAPTSILATGYTVTDKDNLATEIIGKQVYSSTAKDAEHIGDVNNLVVGPNGEIAAVVIGVGGFLGIGEKNVAVNYSELQWVVAEDNSERFVLPTTKDALEAAPEFKAEDQTPPPNAAPADNAMAPADNNAMAPANNNAMAPADNTMAANNQANANATAAPETVDTTGFTDVQLTADELEGTTAYGPNNEKLGKIDDVVLSEDGKNVEAVVVDFGGFLGIGAKKVAVAAQNLKFQQDQNNNRFVLLNVTREQLDQAQQFDANTFKTNRDQQLLTPQG
ncbi:MAG: PRC-barrel domain-containing protein [Devosia sp.]